MVMSSIVGRRNELELLQAAPATGAHLMLEGPVSAGKSTLLRHVAGFRRTPSCLWSATPN